MISPKLVVLALLAVALTAAYPQQGGG